MTATRVLAITGYLGAGKTTLINHLLACPAIVDRDPALIINEFGTIGVDGQLIREGRWRRYEINSGSIFCVCTQVQLRKALEELATEVRPGVVLLEATGVAEPADLEPYFAAEPLRGAMAMGATLCVVDASTFTQVAPFLQACRRQVEAADGIVINKLDRAGGEDLAVLERVLAEMNPRAPRTAVREGAIDPAFLDGLTHVPPSQSLRRGAPAQVVAASVRSEKAVDRASFDAVVNNLGDRLLRLKGNVDFDSGRRFIQRVGRDEDESPPRDGLQPATAFTAIAFGMTAEDLTRRFETAFVG
ncbi:MAG: CobW family GTP-binding protein [Planctomycetota bacterium]